LTWRATQHSRFLVDGVLHLAEDRLQSMDLRADAMIDGGRSRAPSDPLHVLVLPSWFSEPHGALDGIFFRDQALALQRAGHRVGMIYPARHTWREFDATDFHGRSLATTPEIELLRAQRVHLRRAGPINGVFFAATALRLFRRYEALRGKPDIVHVQGSLWGALGGALIQRISGVPFAVTEHTTVFLDGNLAAWNTWPIRWSLERAGGVVAVSHALARSMTAARLTTRSIEVVPNTVDTDYFQRAAPRKAAGAFTVLTLANLIPRKRVDRTLRAFARAFASDSEVRLEIGGDGSERARLEQLALSLGLQRQVRFLGQLERHEVRAAMQRADLFVLSSERETFGVVLIEALASGLPVVATRAGGPEDIVSSEVGYLVDQNDETGLVATLVDARARIAREGSTWSAHCADYAKQHYGYAVFASRLTALLRSAILRRAPAATPRDNGGRLD
jgi:glycosyltransferase involved in cell wall biosynthesis